MLFVWRLIVSVVALSVGIASSTMIFGIMHDANRVFGVAVPIVILVCVFFFLNAIWSNRYKKVLLVNSFPGGVWPIVVIIAIMGLAYLAWDFSVFVNSQSQ